MDGEKCKGTFKKLKRPAAKKREVTRNGHSHEEVPRLAKKKFSSKRMLTGRLIYFTTSCQVLVWLYCLILFQITHQTELVKGQRQANQAVAENSSSASTFDLVRLSSLGKDAATRLLSGESSKQHLDGLEASRANSQSLAMGKDIKQAADYLRKLDAVDEEPEKLKRVGTLISMQQHSELYHKRADMQVSGAKHPPIYLSAPKEIKAFQEILVGSGGGGGGGGKASSGSAYPQHHKRASSEGTQMKPYVEHEIELVKPSKSSSYGGESDLHTAALEYEKKGKPKKKKKKKPKKIVKKVVIKKKGKKKPKFSKKKLVIVEEMKPYSPAPMKLHQTDAGASEKDLGKYYEYRSVPKKGAWEFGYKRGNVKHTIQRKEHGHKSQFKTEVKWADKKGKGHHLFDYSHTDDHHHHHHHHHHQPEPKMEKQHKSPKKQLKKHEH